MRPPAIALENVAKSFDGHRGGPRVEVLSDVSLEVPAGRFFTIVGPSGCGKTTLLRLIAGLLTPDSGDIRILGEPPAPGRNVGFVFQSFRLLPWATVRTNVAFPLSVQRVPAAERRERVDRYLERVGLLRVADAYPAQLSGGMKQRAAIARALVTEPGLLLMDEPFASVDAQTRQLMQIELMRLWREREMVVLFVTHSIEEAILLGDSVVLMGGRPCRVLNIYDVPLGHPRDVIAAPATPAFNELRELLWNEIRGLVVDDPASDFFGRLT